MKGLKKEIISTSIFSLAGIFAVVSVVFAWFVNTRQADVNELKIGTRDERNLMISKTNDFSLTNGSLIVDIPTNFAFDNISGNGNKFFYPTISPKEVQASDGSTIRTLALTNYEEITEEFEKYGIYCDFYLKINKDLEFYLDESSYVNGVGKTNEQQLIGGATRVAFYHIDDKTNNKELRCIWIPNSTYEYSYSNGRISFNKSGTVEDSYTFPLSTEVNDVFSVETNGNNDGLYIYDDVTYVWGDIGKVVQARGEDVSIGLLKKDVPDHYAIAVWVEGTDRECEKELMGKFINFNINFKVYETEVVD